ncbi:MAG: CrcB family protein [Chloroflexi bacterium]|nr:CrcB family protein [Chloroflexota bacterium]
MIWILVALGGAAGSVLRYGANRLAAHYLGADTVMGTFAVNIAGSFLLGFLATVFIQRSGLPTEVRVMATVGLLGGFTTFSTLAYDGVRLMSSGEYARAGISLAANIVVGLAAAWLGVIAARATV